MNLPLLESITDWQSTLGGTGSFIGGLDIITLIGIGLICMGFTRNNSAVGMIIPIVILVVLAYFGVMQLPIAIVGMVTVIVALGVVLKRRRGD